MLLLYLISVGPSRKCPFSLLLRGEVQILYSISQPFSSGSVLSDPSYALMSGSTYFPRLLNASGRLGDKWAFLLLSLPQASPECSTLASSIALIHTGTITIYYYSFQAPKFLHTLLVSSPIFFCYGENPLFPDWKL